MGTVLRATDFFCLYASAKVTSCRFFCNHFALLPPRADPEGCAGLGRQSGPPRWAKTAAGSDCPHFIKCNLLEPAMDQLCAATGCQTAGKAV